jgi:hypothetical protein
MNKHQENYTHFFEHIFRLLKDGKERKEDKATKSTKVIRTFKSHVSFLRKDVFLFLKL